MEKIQDNIAITKEKGDATGGYCSAVRTCTGNASSNDGSAVRAVEGDATAGDYSAVSTNTGNATGGNSSAVIAVKGNATAGFRSAVKTTEGHAKCGDNSVAMGKTVEIGNNSVGAILNEDGEIIKIVYKGDIEIEKI